MIAKTNRASKAKPAKLISGKRINFASPLFWRGMNERDETDEVTHRPIGRELAAGFAMMQDDEILDY